MKLCRYRLRTGASAGAGSRFGLVADDGVVRDLGATGCATLSALLETVDLADQLNAMVRRDDLPRRSLDEVTLLAPVDRQEVWAAGVTYLRSKQARMDESDFSATAYDRVYAAPRPELFFKALAEKVAGPGAAVGIRADADWSGPEPELALVLNSRQRIVGYTIGNDMSSRDIEGENLLYLPQAKIYRGSCALGPWIALAPDEAAARQWTIELEIERQGRVAFAGSTPVDRIKRSFDELAGFLFRSQEFPFGVVLLTGTGVVPPDDFRLVAGDEVRIRIAGIGELVNTVVAV
jgi:2-dehydro-3-deoxy-D-arabinonate dehydratase